MLLEETGSVVNEMETWSAEKYQEHKGILENPQNTKGEDHDIENQLGIFLWDAI